VRVFADMPNFFGKVKVLLGRVCLPEVIFDKHTEELEAGDFLYFSSINV